jgi:ribulose-phosphate 3-epimerase
VGFFTDLGGRVAVGPSILAADFANLADEVSKARDGGALFVHFDAMDNHFVPNLSIGPPVAASLVPTTDLPVEPGQPHPHVPRCRCGEHLGPP